MKEYLKKVRSFKKYLIGFLVDTVTPNFGVELEKESAGNDAAILADVVCQ
jgi:hypothetical protein